MNSKMNECVSNDVDVAVIEAAKAYLLDEANRPTYCPYYGTKFKRLNSGAFAAYAIVRGKDWRSGIHDLKANMLTYHPDHDSWERVLRAQYGRTISATLIAKEAWFALVDQALSDYPAE
jgi:hypothetical protein